MSHYSQTLYARSKHGDIKTWSISVEGTKNNAKIVIETSSKEGAKSIVREESITKGKNIGRSNETTPLEQAISEAQSRYEEKILKKGYVDNKNKIGAYLTNSFGLPIPMLAKEYESEAFLVDEVFLQRKYNGHRCLYDMGSHQMYSRGGENITTMDHIMVKLFDFRNSFDDHDYVLDGELYVHGMKLQDTTKLIKKHRPESIKVEYHVYDLIDPEDMNIPYQLRMAALDSLKLPYPCVKVETIKIIPELIATKVDKFIEEGYEGGIVRLPKGIYEPGQRSSSLLKVKLFKDAEWKIKDIYEGASIAVNGKNQTAVCVLCTGSCGDFEVTAPGTREEQHKFLKNKKKLIGKMLTIKYYDMTKDGKPFHPIAICPHETI